MKKRTKAKRISPQWVTFPRCFLLTLGMFFVGVSLWAINESKGEENLPAWVPALLFGMLVLGILLLAVVIIGSRRDAETWMDTASRNDAALIVIIIAAPLYLILKLFFSRPGK